MSSQHHTYCTCTSDGHALLATRHRTYYTCTSAADTLLAARHRADRSHSILLNGLYTLHHRTDSSIPTTVGILPAATQRAYCTRTSAYFLPAIRHHCYRACATAVDSLHTA